MKIFIFLIFPLILLADNYVFGPSMRVNDDPPGAHDHYMLSAGQHLIGCRGDTVYLVWSDERTNLRRIYFSRSTDCGNTWSANLRLSSDDPNHEANTPSLALDDQGNIYVCYGHYDWSTFNVDVYFTKSTDGGISFPTPVLVNDTTRAAQAHPSIAVDSSGYIIYIAWDDARNPVNIPNLDIYMAKSTDGGLTFGPSVRVDDTGSDSLDQEAPSIGCTRGGDTVYVVWWDERNDIGDDNYDIYFSRSVDAGMTFEPDVLVNDTVGTIPSTQWLPSLWVNKAGSIYIAWEDNRQYGYKIYFDKSIDNGLSFGQDVNMIDTATGGQTSCSIITDDFDYVYVVWQDSRTFSQTGHDIYFSFSADSGNSFSANVRVNDLLGIESAWDWYPTICVNDSGKIFVAWESDRNDPSHANSDIYCAAGNYVGIKEVVDHELNSRLIHVFPNPFQHFLTVQSQSGKIEHVELFDVAGRSVKSVELNDKRAANLDAGDLPGGVYFIKIKMNSGLLVKKVIKIK